MTRMIRITRMIRTPRSLLCVALGVGVLLAPTACGNGAATTPDPPAAAGGASGVAGAAEGGLGGALVAAAGGAAPVMVPAGQLVCGGKSCHAGGHCAADGSCPAFLGDCFSSVDTTHWDTCDAYCSDHGFSCAEKSCNYDGSSVVVGYSSVSYKAAERAACESFGIPSMFSPDQCVTPIWLLPSKAEDDVVRCCCRG